MSSLAIETFADTAAWAEAAAARLTEALAEGVAAEGRAVFAGAGGSTPSPVYARLAQADLDWSKVTTTLVDERYVPETSPDSNAALMKRTLLTGNAAAARFLPLYSPSVTVDRAAAEASKALAAEGGRLDAALLGMGEDGHICSMFPESPTLKTLLTPNLKPAVYGVPAGRDGLAPSLERLSINLPYLISARRVVLALTGAAKRAVFEREAAGDPRIHPIAAMIAAKVPLEVLWTEAV
ncbi:MULTISPECIES: 6-phosphogluconolactonase [unclassified Brevundimonas]|uniref:6-phosphogluconolactonase n=1 Tax=unclassified Brevundimonas TaxID=2622653 RepID=UPI000CFBDCB2|nr:MULTISPECIES: 6-phosphogluconolactonase [unclassified Brevundimonas]PRA29523.1 6-phosphogluconolactonase [Brevundimonas sp. MYb27]PQZ83640.1 6-phosphogluconolactonase [Brevundimonas sp. MYb31]PRB15772.1 6-phosphogluconolactonase [Brevundimonas sp. MYb52]PRB36268.1 6-phosphogluconolactonase [Brevundimonas sp. MYb46]PRB46821.1 6-phosphogluconolactonase [Brevundimonas sp. MYb33]